jgi:hypothetical protein
MAIRRQITNDNYKLFNSGTPVNYLLVIQRNKIAFNNHHKLSKTLQLAMRPKMC